LSCCYLTGISLDQDVSHAPIGSFEGRYRRKERKGILTRLMSTFFANSATLRENMPSELN
jgi:hypothetical protein